jgi:plasmid stabilization system protein ParE
MVGSGARRSRSLCRIPARGASVARVGRREEIIGKTQVLSEHPQLGRPIAGRQEYRQIALQVLGAAYVFQYRFDGKRLVMLRVFHSRERRE